MRPADADPTRWWRDPDLLCQLGPALAELHRDAQPSVVLGVETRGMLLGPLVAVHLGVGFAEVRKDDHPEHAAEKLWSHATPPDYQDRSLQLTVRRHLLAPRDRVLLVDEWIDTGAQAATVARLVEDAEATWIGVAVIVDAGPPEVRRRLNVRALLRERELPW